MCGGADAQLVLRVCVCVSVRSLPSHRRSASQGHSAEFSAQPFARASSAPAQFAVAGASASGPAVSLAVRAIFSSETAHASGGSGLKRVANTMPDLARSMGPAREAVSHASPAQMFDIDERARSESDDGLSEHSLCDPGDTDTPLFT